MRKHGISKTKGDRVLTALFYVLLTLFSLLCLYPLMLAFAVAFSSEQAVSANGFSIIPQDPSLDTFRYLLSQKMNILIQGYGMTTLITLVGTSCSLIITLMYRLRLSSAYQRLLDERDNTIEKIAQESGFYSSSYFTTLFRKQYGLSPSQARRRLSEKGE